MQEDKEEINIPSASPIQNKHGFIEIYSMHCVFMHLHYITKALHFVVFVIDFVFHSGIFFRV